MEELGWLHVGHRYYDPASGRFMQRDPIGIRGGLNTYVYISNEPNMSVDPSGLQDPGVDIWFNQWWGDHSKRKPMRDIRDVSEEVFDRYNSTKSDKWMHFVVSCKTSSECYFGFLYCVPAGLGKEIGDLIGGASAWDSFGDSLADISGWLLGIQAAATDCGCETQADQLWN